MIDKELKLHSDKTGYTVRMVDAKKVIIDASTGLDKQGAAREFWKRTNNISAMTGIIERVAIIDENDTMILIWEFDKGYSYDGEHFSPSPVLEGLEDEIKHRLEVEYAKAEKD